jgi:hypothetical protein
LTKTAGIKKGDKLKTYTDKYIVDSTVENTKSR